jgi:hypothetical protein
MSLYLVARIRAQNIDVRYAAGRGGSRPPRAAVADRDTGASCSQLAVRLHRRIAAHQWLGSAVVRDEGFIITRQDLSHVTWPRGP